MKGCISVSRWEGEVERKFLAACSQANMVALSSFLPLLEACSWSFFEEIVDARFFVKRSSLDNSRPD